MWPFSSTKELVSKAPLFFTNTLTGKKEPFAPVKFGHATLYSCGPTVYSPQHIGNMRAAVFADLVGRVLEDAGFKTRRVINITDVGHLLGDNEGDADQGEDRMEKSARESGLSAAAIAEKFTKLYLDDIRALNVASENILFPRATEYIDEQIALIKILEEKGHTYRVTDGIYFDTSTFPTYGKLGNIPQEYIKDGDLGSLNERIALAGRARIKENAEKRNPRDFALWKFGGGLNRQQEWNSPWGRGFPGWHIECSAMSKALLGETIDVHTGGIEHIPVHHNNEIAQSESANGKQFARYFLHQAHVTFGGEKLAKSAGNAILLSDIVERGLHPLSLRYLFLQAHYRSSLSFTWDSIEGANEALTRLWRHATELKEESQSIPSPSPASERMTTLLRDDLATPQALALLWESVKDENLSAKEAWGVLVAAESVLGLSLTNPPFYGRLKDADIPEDVKSLIAERQEARTRGDYARADELRIHIENRGYGVEDRPTGAVVTKKSN